MDKRILVAFSTLAVILAFLLGARLYRSQQTEVAQVAVADNQERLVREYAPRLGREGAPVTIVEFFDPECESCKAFHPITKMLLEEYEGKIQIVFRYAPFHPNSQFAVKILEAARKQNRYWETLDVLYEHQPEWGDHHHPKPELVWKYLPKVDMNIDQLKKDMDDPVVLQNLMQDIKDGQELGVKMTPSFFVNGEPLTEFGPGPLRALIEKHLGEKL